MVSECKLILGGRAHTHTHTHTHNTHTQVWSLQASSSRVRESSYHSSRRWSSHFVSKSWLPGQQRPVLRVWCDRLPDPQDLQGWRIQRRLSGTSHSWWGDWRHDLKMSRCWAVGDTIRTRCSIATQWHTSKLTGPLLCTCVYDSFTCAIVYIVLVHVVHKYTINLT